MTEQSAESAQVCATCHGTGIQPAIEACADFGQHPVGGHDAAVRASLRAVPADDETCLCPPPWNGDYTPSPICPEHGDPRTPSEGQR